MNSQDLIEALKEVPERRLRIIELAWKVARDGRMDPDLAAFHALEIEEAAREARAYIEEAQEVLECLRRLAKLLL